MVLKALFRMLNDSPQQISNSRDVWFNMAMMYINKNLDKHLKTSDICDHVKISERNLRHGFKDLIGISPKKFIKILRLNKARKDIKLAKENAEISIIANRWGFGHSGQFAADYKRLFGEFPSEGIRR
jgi:AraC family ethanolamine operon transcriptional activator